VVKQRALFTKNGPGMLVRRRTELYFALVVAVYLLFHFHYGRFEATDELFFKAPGKNWAETGRFNAPELTWSFGREALPVQVDEIFFMQPPLYPFLFGVFVKLFGFGWRQCVMYDAVIHAGLMLTTFLLTKGLVNSVFSSGTKVLRPWLCIVPALMIMPLGQAGRPDELAMTLGMIGLLLLLRGQSLARVIASAIFFGMSAGTSAGAAIELGLVAAGLMLFRNTSVREKVRNIVSWAVSCVFVLSLVLSPILIKYPAAYRQYLLLAQKYLFQLSPTALDFALQFGKPYFLLIAAALAVATCGLLSNVRLFRDRGLSALWIGTMAAVIFALCALPGKYTYLWFVLPVLIATAFVSALYIVRQSGHNGFRLILAAIALFSLSAYAWAARDALVLIGLDDEQRPAYNERRLREIIPEGSAVIVHKGWWFLGDRATSYDSMFSSKADLTDIDYIILSATGSGRPGVPHLPANPRYKGLLLEQFEEVYNNLSPEPNKILGVTLSHSGNGFGLAVYKRRHRDG